MVRKAPNSDGKSPILNAGTCLRPKDPFIRRKEAYTERRDAALHRIAPFYAIFVSSDDEAAMGLLRLLKADRLVEDGVCCGRPHLHQLADGFMVVIEGEDVAHAADLSSAMIVFCAAMYDFNVATIVSESDVMTRCQNDVALSNFSFFTYDDLFFCHFET